MILRPTWLIQGERFLYATEEISYFDNGYATEEICYFDRKW